MFLLAWVINESFIDKSFNRNCIARKCFKRNFSKLFYKQNVKFLKPRYSRNDRTWPISFFSQSRDPDSLILMVVICLHKRHLLRYGSKNFSDHVNNSNHMRIGLKNTVNDSRLHNSTSVCSKMVKSYLLWSSWRHS